MPIYYKNYPENSLIPIPNALKYNRISSCNLSFSLRHRAHSTSRPPSEKVLAFHKLFYYICIKI